MWDSEYCIWMIFRKCLCNTFLSVRKSSKNSQHQNFCPLQTGASKAKGWETRSTRLSLLHTTWLVCPHGRQHSIGMQVTAVFTGCREYISLAPWSEIRHIKSTAPSSPANLDCRSRRAKDIIDKRLKKKIKNLFFIWVTIIWVTNISEKSNRRGLSSWNLAGSFGFSPQGCESSGTTQSWRKSKVVCNSRDADRLTFDGGLVGSSSAELLLCALRNFWWRWLAPVV